MRHLAASLLMIVAPLAAPFVPLAAQDAHPNLTGTWTLDPAQSGDGAQGVSATVTITQSDKTIKVEQHIASAMGNQNNTLNFNLDGSPSKNTVNASGMAIELNSTAVWEGATLVVKSTADVQGNAVTTVEHWSVDAAGKKLTLESDISFGGQSMSRKQVFNKS